MSGGPPAVSMRGISRRFGAVQALDDVTFDVRPGEVHALLGENGAGKSTLMHVLCGLLHADAGAIEVFGMPLRGGSPREAMARGLGLVPQNVAQVPRMSAAENAWLGRAGWRFDRRAAEAALRRAAEQTGLAVDAAAPAGELPIGVRQRLEILKALTREVRVLVLDEPTASLVPGEIDDLFAALRRLVSAGLAVVLITHKLREVAQLSDRVTILRRGRVVLSAPAAGWQPPDLARAMIGEGAPSGEVAVALETSTAPRRPPASSATAIEVRGVSVRGPQGRELVRQASFAVGAGEIVGVAAVEGNGQRELLRALAGILPHGGEIAVPGSGVGYIPEDRLAEGVIPDFTIAENLALGAQARFWINPRDLARRASEAIQTFRIAAEGPDTRMRHLSGGNQQKVVLARVLSARPSVLVAENPTRGLDIRASADVHAALRAAAAQGAGVLLYSADLDEVLALADRVAVMLDGHWLPVPEAARNRAGVGAMMLGAAA